VGPGHRAIEDGRARGRRLLGAVINEPRPSAGRTVTTGDHLQPAARTTEARP
jgi:hypothetical protein